MSWSGKSRHCIACPCKLYSLEGGTVQGGVGVGHQGAVATSRRVDIRGHNAWCNSSPRENKKAVGGGGTEREVVRNREKRIKKRNRGKERRCEPDTETEKYT